MLKLKWCKKMNDNILIILNWYDNNTKLLNKRITSIMEIFANLIIINNTSKELKNISNKVIYRKTSVLEDINSYIKKSKKNITDIVFLDGNISITNEDIVECLKEVRKEPDKIIMGINEEKQMSISIINNIFNMLFNTSFKNIYPPIKALNIKLFNKLLKGSSIPITDNNYIIAAIESGVFIKERDVKTIYRKNNENKPKRTIKSYLKTLWPYLIKSLSPYFLTLFLFLIIFYLQNSGNDLKDIFIANFIAEGVGIVTHIIINYNIIYKRNLIINNGMFIFKNIFRIIIASFIIYFLYNLNINLFISKLFIDAFLFINIAILFRFFHLSNDN